MPPKIDFKADDSAIDFQEVDPTGETFNLNDVVKLKPYQMAGFVNPEDITTGPERTINPITKRDDNEGFWSKALNLPEARKAERNDSIMFSSGLDYSKVGEFIKEHLPEGKISDLLAGLGSFIASTPEAVLSDPTTPAIGLLGAGKALAPRAELKTRLENIKTAPVEPIPDAPKLRLGLTAEGKLEPRGLISPEEFTSQQTIKALEGKPLELRKPVDFVPDSVKAEPIVQAEPGNIQPESSIPVVNNESRVVSDSTANRLADLAKQFVSDTEGSLKPKELVENVKQQVLRLRGKTPEEVNTIKQELISALSNKRRIDTNQLYSLVQDRLSKAQFEKTLINLLDSGEIQKSIPKKAAAKTIPLPANVNEAQTPEQAIDILMNNIKANTAARIEQDLAVSAERKARIKEAANVTTGGMQGYFEQLSKLKGKYPAVKAEIQKELISPQNVDTLYSMIRKHPELSEFDRISAQGALSKLLGIKKSRGALQPSELSDLQKVFGERATNNLVEMYSGLGKIYKGVPTELFNKGLDIAGQAKGLKFGGDIGWPLRQGIAYAGQPEWFKAIYPSIKGFFSEKSAENTLRGIKESKDYADWLEAGLSITDFRGHGLREEHVPVDILPGLRKKPYIGKVVNTLLFPSDASNRAAVTGLDTLRFGMARRIADSYDGFYRGLVKEAKGDTNLLAEAEKFNPKSLYVKENIADLVNTATGRGKLPEWMQGSEKMLNHLMTSPKLVSSRLRTFNRIFNPLMYQNYDKVERMHALQQLASIGITMGLFGAIGKAMGAKIGNNPTSADFLKPRFDKTRLDPSGGLLSYVYPFMRLYFQATTNGEDNVRRLGDFGVPTGTEIATNALLGNRKAPVADLVTSVMNQAEFGGRPLNFSTLNPMENTLTRTMGFPVVGNLMVQDMYDMYKENPKLIPPMGLLDFMGVGVNTYGEREKKPKQKKLILKKAGPFGVFTVPAEED